MPFQGACLCKQVKYQVNVDNPSEEAFLCHCRNCQIVSSACTFNATVPKDAVKLLEGTPQVYLDTNTKSGKPLHRSFCGNCGTALWSYAEAMPESVFVKVGSLEKASSVRPNAQVFADGAMPDLADTGKLRRE